MAIALGNGPVNVVPGFTVPPPAPGGVVALDDDLVFGGRRYHKTLIAIDARYRGPVLLRGAEMGGAAIRFDSGLDPVTETQPPRPGSQSQELVIPRGRPGSRRWRYQPTSMLLTGPGCYFLQIDAAGFSEQITFRTREVTTAQAVEGSG